MSLFSVTKYLSTHVLDPKPQKRGRPSRYVTAPGLRDLTVHRSRQTHQEVDNYLPLGNCCARCATGTAHAEMGATNQEPRALLWSQMLSDQQQWKQRKGGKDVLHRKHSNEK